MKFFSLTLLIIFCIIPPLFSKDRSSRQVNEAWKEFSGHQMLKFLGKNRSFFLKLVKRNRFLRNKTPDIIKTKNNIFYSFKNDGIMFVADKNKITAVEFYGPGSKGFKRYYGRLPLELNFSNHREDVRSTFGKPKKKGYFNNENGYGYEYSYKHLFVMFIFNNDDGVKHLKMIKVFYIGK